MKELIEKLMADAEVIYNATAEVKKEVNLLLAEVPSLGVVERLETQLALVMSINTTAGLVLRNTIQPLTTVLAAEFAEHKAGVDAALEKLQEATGDLVTVSKQIYARAHSLQSFMKQEVPGAEYQRQYH